MATKAKIAPNEQRRAIVAKYAERRRELTALIARPSTDPETRERAIRELRRQPRNASPARVRNRDSIDGRPCAYFRAFGVSRIRLRELAHEGALPGVRKSSW